MNQRPAQTLQHRGHADLLEPVQYHGRIEGNQALVFYLFIISSLSSSKEPYLGLRLILDPAVVTSTMLEAGLVHRQNDSGVKAIAVSALDPDLLNACLRLARLLQMPEQYQVLGPLVIREIVYRLLIGEQHLENKEAARAQRIAVG
jgi:hypothetical protein